MLLAPYATHASLASMVPIADRNADGQHCSQSPLSVHDPLQGPHGEAEDIVGIAKVTKDHQVVGFIYRTASGRFYAQALETMPYKDQEKAGVTVGSTESLRQPHIPFYSATKQIKTLPWSDLTLLPCK